jgi:arabinofuranosyltransferase
VTAVTIVAWLLLAALLVIGWSRVNERRLWRFGALGLTLVLALFHQLAYATVAGDAYVTFRYARNLAEGHGPVYNIGEYVEGYANFLWMVLVAIPGALLGDPDVIVAAAVTLGVGCVFGCVLLAYTLTNRIVRLAAPRGRQLPGLGVVAAAFTAASSSLTAYGASGVEIPLFVLLVLVGCLALTSGRAVVAGVTAALAVMTRPEGLVVAAIGLLWFVVEAARGRRPGPAAVAYLAGWAVLQVPWTVWRLTAYEHLVPNLSVARWSGDWSGRLATGWDYVAGFLLAYLAFVALAVVTLALVSTRRSVDARARSVLWLLAALAAGQLVGVLVSGGGWMPTWRLLAAVPVLLGVLGVAAFGVYVVTAPVDESVSGSVVSGPEPLVRGRTVPVVATVLCGLALVVTTVHPRALPAMQQLSARADQLAEIGRWFGSSLPPGTVVSTHHTGALAYEAGPSIVVVDVYGRTDEHIARQGSPLPAAQGIYVSRDFDYVVNERVPSVAIDDPGFTTSQECGINPAYAGLYEVASFRRVGTPYWVSVYVRRMAASELIELLDADPNFSYVSCP